MSDKNDLGQECTSKAAAALDAVRAYRRSPPTIPPPPIPPPPIERIAWLSPDDVICTRNADGGVTAWSRNDAEALFHLLDSLLDDQQKRSDAQEPPAP